KGLKDCRYVPLKTQDGELTWWCDMCDIGWVDEYGLIRRSKGSSRGTIVPFTQHYRSPIPTPIFRYSTISFTFKCTPLYRTLFLRLFILPFFPLPNTRTRG
ncbi:hypothetical protein NEUTE2DRAFT_62669, partial [Neurospora tetrasperma FGSC 2509]